MKTQIITSLKMLLVMTLLTGILYPVVMTAIAQLVFPNRSNGSIIEKYGASIGSKLIGQNFQSDKYFWSRPSAIDYNPLPSGATNYAPTNRALKDSVDARREYFLKQNFLPLNTTVPTEMLCASASGIDPHISPEAALMQIERIGRARGFTEQKILTLINLVHNHVEGLQMGFLGEPRVNVLMLNIILDEIQ
jgi:potassium-transporting ATPase KdpC subunit